MPKIGKELPENLRMYNYHGMDLHYNEGDTDATCDCPFCGAEGKFGILVENGQYQCWKCKTTGNARVFMRELVKKSYENTVDYTEIMEDRGLLKQDPLMLWEVAQSITRPGEWILPGYTSEEKVGNVFRYIQQPSGKRRAMSSPKPHISKFTIFGMNQWDQSKGVVDILEGPWDGLAFYDVLLQTKVTEDGEWQATASHVQSLAADHNVIAFPGSHSFPEDLIEKCADKIVNLWGHNDWEKTNKVTGETIPPASFAGIKKIASMLLNSDTPPLAINYLYWGENGYTEDHPSGYDVRDTLNDAGDSIGSRIPALQDLFSRLHGVPDSWATEGTNGTPAKKRVKANNHVELLSCTDWETLVASWRKALHWIDGLDVALSVMLSSITSTMAVGDQLWVEIISPPSTGKSQLCEAVSVNKKYVIAKSTIRGFHSGFGLDGEDKSLIVQAAGKTLVTKDGDTLLQSPNLGQILAEARDVYDTVSRTHYRTGNSHDYEGVRLTWILCGTSSLLSLDTSELGERFLKCIIMDGIDDDLEDKILLHSAEAENRNMGLEAGKNAASKESPEVLEARALTGGYVTYLRENATELLGGVTLSPDMLWKCTRYGKFVAYMRARPSKLQSEQAERELASRLVKQTVRLAKCLAVVLNRNEVDDEVMRRVHKVAMDTSRGTVLKIARCIMKEENVGFQSKTIATELHMNDEETRKLLRFLRTIGAVETFKPVIEGVKSTMNYWRLTNKVAKLYEEVMGNSEE